MSASVIFKRGLFTDLLLARVATAFGTASVLVGDGEAPGGGGWSGQQAGSGTFVPYVALISGTATKNLTDPLGRRKDSSWSLNYSVRGAGGNRQQADFACDAASKIFSDLAKQQFACGVGNVLWHVLKAEYTSLGGITPNNATDPPLWERVDGLEIWLDLGP